MIRPLAAHPSGRVSSRTSACSRMLEQFVDAVPFLAETGHEQANRRRILPERRLRPPVPADAVRVGVRLVDLVDRHDQGHAGRLGVVDGLRVWGITPSSAATTRMTMSVALAPRPASP